MKYCLFLILNLVFSSIAIADSRTVMCHERNSSATDNKMCQTNWQTLEEESKNNSLLSCHQDSSKGKLKVSSYSSNVWTNSSFQGNYCRELELNGTTLTTKLDSSAGGFDTSITVENPTKVDELNSNLTISAKVNVSLQGEGRWWVGPKIPTRSCPSSNKCADWDLGWFENYVVENASDTPQQYHDRLSSEGRYLGQTTQDGSVYKHYYKAHKEWGQFWAIRQNYRESGSVNVGKILNYWRSKELPNDYLTSIRANFEVSGKWCGEVRITDYQVSTNFR